MAQTAATRHTTTTLDATAHRMRQMVADGAAYAHWRLTGGLELVLSRKAAHWRLALARPGVMPSEDEITICQRSFSVPEGTEQRSAEKIRTGKLGQPVRWHVVEMTWLEQEVAA